MNRGHNWASEANRPLSYSIKRISPIALHAILGLPGETSTDFQATAKRFAQMPIQAVKSTIYIEKGTTLALEHALTPLPVFNEYTFGEHLIDFISSFALPSNHALNHRYALTMNSLPSLADG